MLPNNIAMIAKRNKQKMASRKNNGSRRPQSRKGVKK